MKRFFPLVVVLACAPVWAQNSLSVRVVDAQGAPIAGAQVQVWAWSGGTSPAVFRPQVTDAKGTVRFSLPTLLDKKPFSGRIVAGAKGFAFGGAYSAGNTAEIKLEKGVPWRGRVADEAGKPLAGATVRLRGAIKERDFQNMVTLAQDGGEGAVSALYSTRSGADGSFTIANAPADKDLMFQAQRAGYSLVSGQGGRAGVEQPIKLARAGSLHGRVLGVDGKPLVNLRILASGSGFNEAKTDARGEFTITNLAAGVYKLIAYVPDKSPYLMTRRTDVRVTVGKTGEVGSWRAQRGVVIRGLVRDAATKKPLANASFAADSREDVASNNDSAWSSSDATGHFQLRVFPGQYTVRCGGAPLNYLRSESRRRVGVDAQGRQSGEDVSFLLKAAPLVSGVTLDESGHPIAAHLVVGEMFAGEVKSDAKGRFEYRPSAEADLTFGGGSDENGYFEVVSPKKVDWPATGPLAITMRYKPWVTLEGRVVTPQGTPVEGARVDGHFLVAISDRTSMGGQSSATSDRDGRYMLHRLRDSREPDVMGTDITVSAQKEGFDFQSGGAVSHQGNSISVSDLVFVPLAGKIAGTTQAGAQVVVAGRETRADAGGHFAFSALPAGQNTVFAAKGGSFGSAPAQEPLAIELQPLRAQGQDQALAAQIWASIRRRPAETVVGLQEWLKPPSFEEAMKAALAAGDSDQISEVAGKWQTGDSLETLRAGLEAVMQSDRRAEVFLKAALATGDTELAKRALEISEAIFKGPTTDSLWREPQLYRAAVLRERLNGVEEGRLALSRALVYTLENHPEKSRIEGAMQTQVGRDEALCKAASIVAQGSPALLRELLDSIDEGSGFTVRALVEAIPVVVKWHGLEAGAPLLTELKKMPTPAPDGDERYLSFDPAWAYGRAVSEVIPLIGAQSPAKALELARGVEEGERDNGQRALVLWNAARFQTPGVAAPLYREAMKTLGTDDAPRMAAMVWENDPKLGLELFGVARQKAAEEMKSPFHYRNAWLAYAFYFARANPAQARLVLEREWSQSVRAKTDMDQRALIAIAMTPADAHRALELADQLPSDNGWDDGTRRKIARYVFADEATRQAFVLNRDSVRAAWDTGTVQW